MNTFLLRISKQLNEKIDGTSIGIFRIGFGVLMIWEMYYLRSIDFVQNFIEGPQLSLKYHFASFIDPLPPVVLEMLIILLMISCILIVLGKLYRYAMAFFFLGFSYIFLLDKAYYNNHLYLICLIALLMIFIPADRNIVRTKKDASQRKDIKKWHLLVLKLQIVIVYFFGGIAKLNYDWLVNQQPVKIILEQKATDSIFSGLLLTDVTTYFIAYGGGGIRSVDRFLFVFPKIP